MSARDDLARVVHDAVCLDGCLDEPEEWHYLVADAVLAEWLPTLADDAEVVAYVENFVPLGFDPRRDPYSNVSEAARAILAALAATLSPTSPGDPR